VCVPAFSLMWLSLTFTLTLRAFSYLLIALEIQSSQF